MEATEHQEGLIIFIKNPELGKVKTRLAATVGDEMALKIYGALLEHTRNIALALRVNRHLYYSQFIDPNDSWNANYFHKYLQSSGDLGQKMAQAFKSILNTHSKAIIIGSDCASLSPEIIDEAFVQLDNHDFVIGPATDGGYYLLGMKQLFLPVFEEVAWSTDQVFATTIERITAVNASYYLLPELSDIDYEEDWNQFGWPL